MGSPEQEIKAMKGSGGEAAGCAWAASFLGEQWDKKNSFGQVKWRKPLGYV